MKPTFFKTPQDFRKWLAKNHNTATELLVGYYKKDTGIASITWPQSVDEALCYGWIDGIRKRYDEKSYTIRFTPRRPNSVWSAVNIKKIEELTKKGLMQPSGIAAYEKLKQNKAKIYSFEQDPKNIVLPKAYIAQFKQNKKAWQFFQSSAPSYQKAAIWWVISAKQETTQQRRLNTLITDSQAELKVKHLRR